MSVAHQQHFAYSNNPFGVLGINPVPQQQWGILTILRVPPKMLYRKIWVCFQNAVPNRNLVLQLVPEYVSDNMLVYWTQIQLSFTLANLNPYRAPDLMTPNAVNIHLAQNFDPLGGLIGNYKWSRVGEYGENGGGSGPNQYNENGASFNRVQNTSLDQSGYNHGITLQLAMELSTLLLFYNDGTASGIHQWDFFMSCQSNSMPQFQYHESIGETIY